MKERFIIVKNNGADSNIYPYRIIDRDNGCWTMKWCFNIVDAGRKLARLRNNK